MLQFFKKQKLCTKNKNSALYKFHFEIYFESFVSTYYLYHLSGIICKSIFYKNITLNYWLISKTIDIRGNRPWVPGILCCNLTYFFSFFLVIATFEVTSCIFVFKCDASIALLPFLSRHYGPYNL